MSTSSRVWIITGATSGTGRALVEAILAKGTDKVVGTSRDVKKFDSLPFVSNPNFLGVQLDYTDASLTNLVAKTIERFGTIDIVVNNAGQGSLGAIEELSNDEIFQAMETNYFNPVKLTKAVLPTLRAKKSGYIVNIASGVGIDGLPRMSAYCASKAAIINHTESLKLDVKDFNINVSVVVLGLFKTNFSNTVVRSSNSIEEYETLKFITKYMGDYINRYTPGDVQKFADLMLEFSYQPSPPLHIVIGTDSVHAIEAKSSYYAKVLESQKENALKVNH